MFELQEVIPTMDMAVNEMFFEKYPDTVLSHQVQVRPFNADKTRNMRALNPEGKYSNTFQFILFFIMILKIFLSPSCKENF